MNMIQSAKDQIAALTRSAYRAAVQEGLLPDGVETVPAVEIPKDTANGDYTTTFCLAASKAMRKNPREVANILTQHMKLDGTYFTSVEIAGPGFLNFRLGEKWYADVVEDVEREADAYGRGEGLKGKKYMVEFVSANPTGPMHMGNARGGVLGDCIAEVLSRAGNDVWREFLINDAGNQVEKFAQSLEARYIQALRGEESFAFPEDGYHGDDIRELAGDFIDEYGDKYLHVSERERRDALAAFGLKRNIARMKSDLKRYKIEYDRWFCESELHNAGYVKETMELLKKSGHTYEKDGALWLKTTDFGCEKDDVLMRANGFYTYFAADIAYHREKFEKRGFDRVINVWGADHHGHVARLKAALDALGLDGSHRLEIVLMQLVRLMRDGEVVRMSKRTGKAISLSDLLDEIPVDAARFFFNSRAADTHLEFDLGLAVRQDSENPVYYVKYAHARIMSIIRNLQAEGIEASATGDFSLLTEEAELSLIRQLSKLPEEVRLAARDREPSRLNRYAAETAAAFHRFYTDCRIKDAPGDVRGARIALCLAAKTVIANVLDIIGVEAPDRM